MYNPPHFADTRQEILLPAVRERGVGIVVVGGSEGPEAALLPLEVDAEAGLLRCHVARANSLWKQVRESPRVLVMVMGADHYISPQWYPAKAEHGRVVPTWNYEVIHLYGSATVFEDPHRLRAHLEALTQSQEGRFPAPWKVSDAPAAFLEGQLRAIVGLEIEIYKMEGKFKLGQNRSQEDRQGSIEGLESLDTPASVALADAMRRRLEGEG